MGSIGDIGCFSFFPSKNLGGFGDGGIVTTNDDALGEKLRILRVHGSKPKYYHKMIGGNFRIDEIQAAVLNVKFPHLDGWSAKRRVNAELYTKLFIEAGLAEEEGRITYDDKNKVLLPKALYKSSESATLGESASLGKSATLGKSASLGESATLGEKVVGGVYNYHIYNQYVIRVKNRDEMRKHLAENEIGSEIYYPVPFHQQECFKHLNQTGFPVADDASLTSIALPIYPELTEEMIRFVVETIAKGSNKVTE